MKVYYFRFYQQINTQKTIHCRILYSRELMTRKQITKIIYFFILLILIGIGSFILNDNSSEIMRNDTITYLLNTRSKKVHSKDCGVGQRSKDKNKQYRTDALTNIVSDGYTICGDCNAGIKKSFITNIINMFDDHINVDYDDIELPTREEYLKAVENIGEWYINHIPTYCKVLQEEAKEEYNGIEKYIDKIELETKNRLFNKSVKYNYLTENNTSITIDDLSINDKVLRANENAIYNYSKEYSQINVKGGILQYPCEFITESPQYNKAGDDCVRYLFTVLNSIDPQFVERIAKTSKKKWSNINTGLICNNKDIFANAMLKNGFIIYDSDEDMLEKSINRITRDFKLERGDIICRDGHIHIFIGNNGTDNFGWGKVNRYFPANYNFSIEEIDNQYKIRMDKGNSVEYYNRIYRYIGGN